MSRRGSAQLLLLSFRSRRARVWMIGTMVGAVAAVALVQVTPTFLFPAEAGLIQALRQSAWQYALAGLPESSPLPWANGAAKPAPSVPRLGLSASLVKTGTPSGAGASFITPGPAQDPHLPPKLSEVNIGDHITVTAADGSSRIYRVTGCKIVDPHLADPGSDTDAADGSLVTCLSLDARLAGSLQLIIQATRTEPAPSEPGPEL